MPSEGPVETEPGVAGLAVKLRGRGRGRRPSQEVRDDVLEAAARVLFEEGVAGFAFERIAVRAGVSRTTLYNRWPSRGALATEALARSVDDALRIPDTGDVAADLTAHLREFVRVLTETRGGRLMTELLGAAQSDPDLAEAFRRVYLRPRRAVGIAALRTAQTRGQVREDADLEALSDQLWGACVYRLMTGQHPLDDAFVDALVRVALEGVRRAR